MDGPENEVIAAALAATTSAGQERPASIRRAATAPLPPPPVGRPPRQPSLVQRQPGTPTASPALASYVSEPPSTLTMLKTYALEFQQGQAAAAAAGTAEQVGAAPHRGGLQRSTTASIPAATQDGEPYGPELPALPAAAKQQVLERPPHFQVAAVLGSPRRRTTEAGGAAVPRPRLRSSIGWVTSNSPSSGAESTVLEHRVAGDLIMPAPGGQRGGRASDDMRRRLQMRTSQQSGGPGSPSPVKGPGGAANGTQHSPLKGGEAGGGGDSQAGEGDDLESLDYDASSKPWYKRRSFWVVAGPLLVSLVFIIAGTLYITLGKGKKLNEFEIWRLCFFLAGLPIIWWIGRGVMEAAVWGVEKTMFTWHNALYYAYAVRRPMANLIRAALTTGWWALMLTTDFNGTMNSELLKWYNIVLKLLGCATLFMTAQLLKVLFAKMLSSKFNQAAHYAKMHLALKREYLLHMLLQPRQRYTQLEELEGEEYEEGGDGGDDGGLAPRQLSMRAPRKQSSLGAFFSRTSRSAPDLQITKNRNRSFKDKMLFWRSSQKDLHPIDEDEEAEEGQELEERSAGGVGADCGALGKPGQLPPDAVALEIGADSSMEQGTITPESPLLHQRTSSSAGMSAAATAAVAGPAAPPRLHGTPGVPKLSIATKLERHRSDALEAMGLQKHGSLTPRSDAHPGSGAHTPGSRRHSFEREHSDAARGLPPVWVPHASSNAAGSVSGLSREPSVVAAPAMSRGRPSHGIRRSASMQSRGAAASAATSPAKRPSTPPRRMMSGGSLSGRSDGDSQKMMALKMSKMEKYIRKHALEVTFKDALSRTERSERVTTELEAKRLGFYLFHNIKADFNRDHVTLEDLEGFTTEKDAKAAMDMLDGDGNGMVNVQECCAAIATMFVERSNLAASLKDARTIVGKLETVIGVVLHTINFFLFLIIFNVDVMKTWTAFASLILSLSFVFGNSIRTTYENVVFLFLVHPYDIGDTLFLDNDQVRVDEIHLSFTVLKNSSNGRLWYPNEKVRVAPFINLTNSGNKGESFKVQVDLNTSAAVIEALHRAGEEVVRANPKEFNGTLSVNVKEGAGPMKVQLSVYWEYTHSGADGGRTGRNRTKMITALSAALDKAGARYTWPATADGSQVSQARGFATLGGREDGGVPSAQGATAAADNSAAAVGASLNITTMM